MSEHEAGSATIRPRVGLTTYLQRAQTGVWDVTAGLLPAQYLDGVTRSGGIALLLPPQQVDPTDASRIIDGLDALVLTGGSDVDPELYGQEPHAETDRPAVTRDAFELALLHCARERGLPVLGICRGAQVLNVALGGSLHQHLPDVVGDERHRAGNAVFTPATVHTEPGSQIAEILGPQADVQCYHHQAIATVGTGLRVGARTEDGVIEGIESVAAGDNSAFCLGVQWHPEENLDDLRVFAALVAAARVYASDSATGRGINL